MLTSPAPAHWPDCSMRLYFVRHGIAAPGHPDHARALTEAGSMRVRLLAEVVRAGRFRVEHVLASPLRRAHETAALLAEALDLPVETDRLLAPGSSLADVAELAGRYDADELLFVGHQPDLSGHLYALTGCPVPMQPGALAVVRTETVWPGRGSLYALLDPGHAARLGAHLHQARQTSQR